MLTLPALLRDLTGWQQPRPPGPAVRDPGHCPECARLAKFLDRPWRETDVDVYAALRASPLFLTDDAFAHYLPGYLAAAALDSFWGPDHYELTMACLYVGRSTTIRTDDWTLYSRLARALGSERGWLPSYDLDRHFRGADDHRQAAPTIPYTHSWHWIGEVRGRIEAAFPAVALEKQALLNDEPLLSSERAMVCMFADRPWTAQPSWLASWNRDGICDLLLGDHSKPATRDHLKTGH